MQNIRQRILKLLNQLYVGAYEREEAISLAVLSAIAGESIFLLGLPGVGKSMISRRLKMAFKKSSSFEYLMSRFSTPDEIFGPVSISKLKDGDTYERVVDGYLPTADIVFLDEIWKAGPAIQNSLLTALNEKIFRNGNHDIQLPLKAVISASNELPAEGEGLEALWDRFLVRYIVEPIHGKDKFQALFLGETVECHVPEEIKITGSELTELQNMAMGITVPDEIMTIICEIRDTLMKARNEDDDSRKEENDDIDPPYVSDRRWKKVGGILRTSALLNGRNEVDFSDCLLLEHLLWDNDEQLSALRKMISQAIINSLSVSIRTIMKHSIDGKSYSVPVGNFISTDGKHYEFNAGGETVFISKDDYNSLTAERRYVSISDDNILSLTEKATTMTICSSKPGTVTLNSFTYPLRRDTELRSGSIETMLNDMTDSTDSIERIINSQVTQNIFLRPYRQYADLRNGFANVKTRIKKLKF